MKHDEKNKKNREAWWTDRKTQEKSWKIEKTMKNEKQWKMMKNREATMKNDEKERKKQWTMMKKIGQNNATWWKIGKKRKHNEK